MMHNALLAKQILKRLEGEENGLETAFGAFIEEEDFFQKERARMIKEFSVISVDDDLRALQKETLL